MDAIVDIELAYQQSMRGAHSSRQVNLSMCTSQLPYTVDFSEMKQTRHGYGTKRAIRRVPLTGGHSLQSLLQYPSPITGGHSISSNPSLLTSSARAINLSSVGGTFSLSCGPATSMAKASTGSRGSASSSGSVASGSTATTSTVSHSKPSARRGRGKKSASSLEKGEKKCELYIAMSICNGMLITLGLYI